MSSYVETQQEQVWEKFSYDEVLSYFKKVGHEEDWLNENGEFKFSELKDVFIEIYKDLSHVASAREVLIVSYMQCFTIYYTCLCGNEVLLNLALAKKLNISWKCSGCKKTCCLFVKKKWKGRYV